MNKMLLDLPRRMFLRLNLNPNPILSGGTDNGPAGPSNDPVHPQFARLWSIMCFAPSQQTFIGDADIGLGGDNRIISVTARLRPDDERDPGRCWTFTSTGGFSTWPESGDRVFSVGNISWEGGPSGNPGSFPGIVTTISGAPSSLVRPEELESVGEDLLY